MGMQLLLWPVGLRWSPLGLWLPHQAVRAQPPKEQCERLVLAILPVPVVQRILVKQGLSIDMAKLLLEDFVRAIKFFDEHQPHGFKGREAEAGNHAGR